MTIPSQDIHISAINTFRLLKQDIINLKGNINIPGLLYIIAVPISLTGIFFYIKTAISSLYNPKLFKTHDLWFAISMFILMVVKIPYFFDKPIALFQFIIFGLLWGIATIILLIVYFRFKSKNSLQVI